MRSNISRVDTNAFAMKRTKRKIRKRWKFLFVLLLFLLIYGFLQVPFGRWTGELIVVSKETTFLTGPLFDDGRVGSPIE